MTDRLAELGALQYAVENLSTAGTNPNRLGLAGYIHAAYTDYQAWAAANPGVNPNRLSARGRLYGYFYDHASWSPLSLFASSEVGAWYDPSDLTTMFQDRAGTTQVTADGQTVGKILDKSGRGNHAVAPSDAARPLYKTDGTYHWLQFDGVDDALSTAAINFTGTDKMSVFSGVKANTANIESAVCTIGSSPFDNGSMHVYTSLSGGGATIYQNTRGSVARSRAKISATYPFTKVMASLFDNSQSTNADQNKLRLNGADAAVTYDDGPTSAGNYLNIKLDVGSKDIAAYLNGNIYSLIVRGALSTTQEITDTETWVNSKTGAF